MGFACISPILAGKEFGTKFGGPGVKLTAGKREENFPYAEVIGNNF